jgi:two-component system nitrate/nitrite response regulator NarL
MRLLIIDDHPMTCEGLKSLLQGYYPHAEIKTSYALSNVENDCKACDFIFLDMHLPSFTFSELLKKMAVFLPKTILISAHPEAAAVAQAKQQGVLGLLPKNIAIDQLLNGFQRITQGERVFLDERGVPLSWQEGQAQLTVRQKEVLSALLVGLSNKQIARKYSISESTVKEHVKAILSAYGARNRLALLLHHHTPVV